MTETIIDSLYQETLEKLKNGKRQQIRLTPELINTIKENWTESLHKVLCILDHTHNSSAEFNELFFRSFNEHSDHHTLIFLLGASQKHIISHSFMTGNMIPFEYFEILKKLLKTKNPELLEWTLRTIESMGSQNQRIKNEIRDSRPGVKKFFNSHFKASDEIINLLEEQWKIK